MVTSMTAFMYQLQRGYDTNTLQLSYINQSLCAVFKLLVHISILDR